MQSILIANGRVIDPAQQIDKVTDVLLCAGKVTAIGQLNGKSNTEKADIIIDASGKLVVPGLIDMHVHLREPGDEEEETIASGSAAAVAGGFTSVACMPNTEPTIDNEATVDFVYRRAATADMANVFAVGAITKDRKGEELAEMGQMVRGGAVAFSDDGSGVQNTAVMLKALQYASMFDKAILQHCQDNALAGKGCMNTGYNTTVLGLPGMSPLAEELMAYRDIRLANKANARLHIQHVSTRGTAAIIRWAKKKGFSVSAEVTPHHLLLSDDACCDYDTNYKMNPPLRSEDDRQAMLEAVADGTIDCLASDHAPHLQSEKELEFLAAPFGIVSLECALGLYVKALVETNVIGWAKLIEMMTVSPAKVLGLENKATLKAGSDADVTIIDPVANWRVDVNKFKSKSHNCPYNGWELSARASCTIVGGVIKYQAK